MEKRPHLDPKSCPGVAYFQNKESADREVIRQIFVDVVGDVPKHMKMAGTNRIWLWLLTIITLIDTGMLSVLIVQIFRNSS